MKIVRYKTRREPAAYGWMIDNMIGPIQGDLFSSYRRLEANVPIERVQLLAPVMPSKIIGIGHNYAGHARDRGQALAELPVMFLKPPSALIGTKSEIILPPQSRQVDFEAELALVIGKPGRWISPKDAMSHVFGYTCANDLTARDLQERDVLIGRSKGFDTFCPLGPWIETELDPSDILISCRLNNELHQMASTHEMLFSIPQIIAYLSSIMTLEVGDVILTGGVPGIGQLHPGDKVEIEIEGIGVLQNSVSAGDLPTFG
ncbi:MAG: fumarylacetoacetate hydrolase family protein [Anaerolineaceae bacterium]|nr:fumarylacetoacetate hydrolase family protein [Anaerolineaceae bacterium]